MKVFDVFLFGYELDLLEIRMNLLDPYVDYFVFSEGGKTFSGEDKGFVFKKTDKNSKSSKIRSSTRRSRTNQEEPRQRS